MKCCEILNIKFKLIIKQEGYEQEQIDIQVSAINSKP